MQSAEEGNFIVVKLRQGEDLFSSLEKIIDRHGIGSGIINSGIGMLKNFELGYFDGKSYGMKGFKEPHELLSMQGSIAHSPELSIHIHAVLSGSKYNVIGGHLIKATVHVLNEITIRKLESIALKRRLNKKTGLKELAVE